MQMVAVLANFFFPGIGTLIIGNVGIGVTQVILSLISGFFFFFVPIIGWLIAIPLGISNWVWALASATAPKSYDEMRHRQ